MLLVASFRLQFFFILDADRFFRVSASNVVRIVEVIRAIRVVRVLWPIRMIRIIMIIRNIRVMRATCVCISGAVVQEARR